MKTRITAIIIAAAMILGLSACADTRSALTMNGDEVRAGEYIYMQIQAAQEGAALFREANPEVDFFAADFNYFNQTLDGKRFSNWVNDRAVEMLKEYKAGEMLFKELGLVITSDEELAIRYSVESFWATGNEDNALGRHGLTYDTWGEFYEDIGIGKDSLASILTYGLMIDRAFMGLYSAEGTEPVEQEEIEAMIVEQYARFRMIEIDLVNINPENTLVLSEEEYLEMATEFAAMLNDGENFSNVYDEYMFFIYLRDFAEEDDPFLDDYNDIFGGDEEEPPVDGDEEEPLVDGDEEEPLVDGDEEEPPVDGDEEEAPVDAAGEHDHNHDHIHDDPFFNPERDLGFDAVENKGFPWNLPADANAFLFEMQVGTAAVFRSLEKESIYVLQRLDILEREDWFDEETLENMLFELKEDEMQERLDAKAALVTVVLNDTAIRRYKPETAVKRGILTPLW